MAKVVDSWLHRTVTEISINQITVPMDTNLWSAVEMSQRVTAEWLWYVLALYAGSFWSPTPCVGARAPPNNPSTIEAQAKFFQDFFSVQLSPYKIEFGHVCEDPNTWEQRYEHKDFKNHRDMGKVRWGDKKGGYGEHYWDLNHHGPSNDHGDNYDNDDGSYHEPNDPYDEPSDNSPTYGEEYDAEKASYEETNRNKRAYPKVKVERKAENYDNQPYSKSNRELLETAATRHVASNQEKINPTAVGAKQKQKRHPHQHQEEKEKHQVVLVFNHKDDSNDENNQDNQYQGPPPKASQYVSYENGAGVRQHQEESTPEEAEATAAASVPRLFLEPSTGHVVDRATGQAYVLQPININK